MILTLLSVLYVICAVLLSLYAVSGVVLLISYLRHRKQHIPVPRIKTWPKVAVQLPLYNERYVVERLLEAVARLDYPRHLLTVQVLDDSTDETSELVADLVDKLRAIGLNIHHIQREHRVGYKAGALAYGLTLLDAEFVAVFDADFVPPPNFLRETVPFMVKNPKLGMVQCRWGHLNSRRNWLTRGQTMALDGHFIVEQTGRNRAGFLTNFSGSGGIWRARTIHDAGGWDDTTLTEDLDLSYRAQLRGWQFLYLPHIEVPAELPPQLAAYKQQQARWAKGGSQCLLLLIGPVWRSPRLTLTQRIMATLHLGQYMTAPLIIALLLLTPPLILTGQMAEMPLGPLGLAGLGPPLMYLASQYALYPDWRRRMLHFPALMVLGTGMAWNNTKAVLEGLLRKRGEFKRTPKYAVTGAEKTVYRLRADRSMIVEMVLMIYALWGTWLAARFYPTLVPYLGIYGFTFAMMILWDLRDLWLESKPVPAPEPATIQQREKMLP